jgi:serine/threonine protein kinase
MDFDLAVQLGDFENCMAANAESWDKNEIGTSGYIAPEVLKGCEYSFPSDMYGFSKCFEKFVIIPMTFFPEDPHTGIVPLIDKIDLVQYRASFELPQERPTIEDLYENKVPEIIACFKVVKKRFPDQYDTGNTENFYSQSLLFL